MVDTSYWDNELKPKLLELHKLFGDTDQLSQFYLGQAIFYVEHDLADGRDPRFRLVQCQGVFNDQSFQAISEFAEFKGLIIEAGNMINQFLQS